MATILARQAVHPYNHVFALIMRPVICALCAERYSTSSNDDTLRCPHRLDVLPAFQTNERIEQLAILMSREVFMREIGGVAAQTEISLLPRAEIEGVFIDDSYSHPIPAAVEGDTIVFGVDPCGGAGSSRFGISAIAYTANGACMVRSKVVMFAFTSENTSIVLRMVALQFSMKSRATAISASVRRFSDGVMISANTRGAT